jgi:hypothetical protein
VKQHPFVHVPVDPSSNLTALKLRHRRWKRKAITYYSIHVVMYIAAHDELSHPLVHSGTSVDIQRHNPCMIENQLLI